MANPPSAPTQSSTDLEKPDGKDNFRVKVIECLALGMSLPDIAKKAYPKNAKKRKSMRRHLQYMANRDARFHAMVAEHARGTMIASLPAATGALGRRSAKGRPDAIKLLYEASGFHNPKRQVEHSGEIRVSLESMPRPKRVETEDYGTGEDVVDAEVVE